MKLLKKLLILCILLGFGCDIPKGEEPFPIYAIATPHQLICGQVTQINPSIILMRPHIVLDSSLTIILTGETDNFLRQIEIGDYIKISKWWEIEILIDVFIETDVKFITIYGNLNPTDVLY